MQTGTYGKAKRTAAGIMAFMVLFVVLFSAGFVGVKKHHHCCTGSDCPVCACVRLCEDALHRIGSGTASAPAGILPVLLAVSAALFPGVLLLQETPVSQKIRMNN